MIDPQRPGSSSSRPRVRSGSWPALASIALLLAGCAGMMPVSEPTPRYAPAARTRPTPPAGDEAARRLHQLVNRHRVSIGLRPLAWSPQAARVAWNHSADMARRGYFSHENREGESPFDRMRAAGLHFRAAGENIAAGQSTADEAFAGWMRSRGHRKNIESRDFTHQGIAVFRDHWTQVFLTPR